MPSVNHDYTTNTSRILMMAGNTSRILMMAGTIWKSLQSAPEWHQNNQNPKAGSVMTPKKTCMAWSDLYELFKAFYQMVWSASKRINIWYW